MVVNDWFMQFLSDTLNLSVDRPRVTETTALGAAYLAGLGAGIYADLSEVVGHWSCDKSFSPTMDGDTRDRLYAGWLEAVSRVRCNG
jgi:glycerol kinase